MKKPGTWLWELRYEKRVKLLDLAKYLKQSASFISQIETGRRDMPEDLVEKFAEFFDKEISYIREKVKEDKIVNRVRKALQDINVMEPTKINALARVLDEDIILRTGLEKALIGEQQLLEFEKKGNIQNEQTN